MSSTLFLEGLWEEMCGTILSGSMHSAPEDSSHPATPTVTAPDLQEKEGSFLLYHHHTSKPPYNKPTY